MGLKKGQLCHYCNALADTLDHIVARCYLPKSNRISMREHQKNKVPCCKRCNLFKGHYRADCVCDICEEAWRIMTPYILPKRKRDIPVVCMADALAISPETPIKDFPMDTEQTG